MLCTILSFDISTRYNRKYGMMDAIDALFYLCSNNAYAETGLKTLAMNTYHKLVPSGSWLMKIIRKIPEARMESMLQKSLDSTVQYIKDMGFFDKPINVAIDKHLIPRYDKKPNDFLIRSRPKAGTTLFEAYATIHCVEKRIKARPWCNTHL